MINSKNKLLNKFRNRGLALYFHFPFCKSKCTYCDFYSLTGKSVAKDEYIEALAVDLELLGEKFSNLYPEPSTIYFGGGTPSLFTPADFSLLIEKVKLNFGLKLNSEITIEINPGDIDSRQRLLEYKEAGINRVSLGVQSLNDDELKLLGRRHDSNQAREVMEYLKDIEINFSIDLISSLPGQSNSEYLESLKELVKYKPNHFSVYNLQLEKGTQLYNAVNDGLLPEISEEVDAINYKKTDKILKSAGYNHYEISSYALAGYQSKHNSAYWRFIPYLGFGPGAHSFIELNRVENLKNLDSYLELSRNRYEPDQEVIDLNPKELRSEFMFLGLRMARGITKKEFKELFGESVEYFYNKKVRGLIDKGFVKSSNKAIKLTDRGKLYANQVFLAFID
ncbi:MAG: radical SAM family heme chaperone HemW [Halarsenatibacteraceae bacterium]